MIKKTIYLGRPAYLSLSQRQLVLQERAPRGETDPPPRTIPIEDIGVLILDHPQLSLTHGILNALLESGSAVITCSQSHMPTGLLLPLAGHSLQSERFQQQLEASLPLRKQLWQQTIRAKIQNQEALLALIHGRHFPNMQAWSKQVRSGDPDNLEARAALFYWSQLFPSLPAFTRDREAEAPNALLNYGYAILRGLMGRALVASGLLPTLGIHHHNRYNAYCLADDMMEPYRPYVDSLVAHIYEAHQPETLTRECKRELLTLPELDVVIDGVRHPLMVGVGLTAQSLQHCFAGEARSLALPVLQ